MRTHISSQLNVLFLLFLLYFVQELSILTLVWIILIIRGLFLIVAGPLQLALFRKSLISFLVEWLHVVDGVGVNARELYWAATRMGQEVVNEAC